MFDTATQSPAQQLVFGMLARQQDEYVPIVKDMITAQTTERRQDTKSKNLAYIGQLRKDLAEAKANNEDESVIKLYKTLLEKEENIAAA